MYFGAGGSISADKLMRDTRRLAGFGTGRGVRSGGRRDEGGRGDGVKDEVKAGESIIDGNGEVEEVWRVVARRGAY